jgi:hypothetical protein
MQGHTGQLLPRFSRPRFTRKPFGWKIDGRDGTESQIYHISLITMWILMETFVARYLAMWALAFLMMALLAISKIPS